MDYSALAEMLLRLRLREATGEGTYDRLLVEVTRHMGSMNLLTQQMVSRTILEAAQPASQPTAEALSDDQSATSEISDMDDATTAPYPRVPDPSVPVRATDADIGMIRAFGAQVVPPYLKDTITEVMLQVMLVPPLLRPRPLRSRELPPRLPLPWTRMSRLTAW